MLYFKILLVYHRFSFNICPATESFACEVFVLKPVWIKFINLSRNNQVNTFYILVLFLIWQSYLSLSNP